MPALQFRQDGKPQKHWTIPPFEKKSQLSVACTLLVPAKIRATTRRYRKVRHTQLHLRHAIVWQLCYPSKMAPPIVVKLAFSPRRHFSTGASPSHTRDHGSAAILTYIQSSGKQTHVLPSLPCKMARKTSTPMQIMCYENK